MKLTLRKSLLAGTALIAVGALSVSTAHAADLTLTGDVVWGTAATGMVATPTAGDNVIMTTHELAFDGTETGVLTAGDITSTTGNLLINTTDDAGNVAFTIGSFTGSSTADITILNPLASTSRTLGATFTNNVSTGGALSISNLETAAATAVTTSVGGTLDVTGATTIIGGAAAGGGATVALDVTGNATFTGAVTLTGGAAAASNTATMTLSGATNTFTGGLTIDTNVGVATLVLDGAVAQTVAGAIAGDGDVTISNTHASGVTFTGANTNTGTITMNTAAIDQAVTFTGDVSSAISLGDNVNTDTKTATFGGAAATAVSGAISGAGAADTIALVFTGGDTVTLSGAATSNIDTVSVTGSTTLDSNAAITATTITVDSGSTLDQGAGAVTGAVVNAGTVQITGAGGIVGNITGAGALDVDADATVTGSVANSVDVADNVTLTIDGTTGDEAVSGAIVINDSGVDDGLAIDAQGNTVTVSGAITTATADQGLVTIADDTGTVAFTADIGTAAAELGVLNIAGGAANTVTTTGNLYSAAITANDVDTIQFLGTSAQAVSGTIAGGIITVGNGTTTSDVTFSGAATSIASANVSAAAKARLEADFTTDGTLTSAGDIYVGDGVTLSADDFANTGAIYLEVKDGGTIGTLEAADIGNIDDSSGALTAGDVQFNVTGNIDTGTVTIGTSGDATAATFTNATATDNSYRYSFALADNAGALDVTVTELAAADIGLTTTNDNTAAVLDTLSDSIDTEILAIVDNFNAAPTQAAANEVLEATASTVDGGAVVAAMGVSNQTGSIADTRLAALRTGDAMTTGMSAGNATNGMQFWGQAFGAVADQNDRDGVNGYDADTFGVAVGMESEALGDNMALGFALAYATTDVDSKNATTTETEVDSYQLTLYGDYDLDSRTYVSGQIGYSFNDNDSTRHNVGGIAGTNATGNYDSNQLSLRVEGGRSYEMSNDLTLTPSVSMAYMNYDADNYTETGAGGANLTVDSDDLSSFEIGVGVEAGWMLEQPDGSVMKPVIRVGVRHDLVGDEFEATNTLAGGGAAFKTKGFDPAQTTFNGGVGLTYFSTENWDFTANYDAEFKSDYLSHAGVLKAAYNF